MNTKQFYGTRKTSKLPAPIIRPIPPESDDSELSDSGESDGEEYRPPSDRSTDSDVASISDARNEPRPPCSEPKKVKNKQKPINWKQVKASASTARGTVPPWNNRLQNPKEVLLPIQYFRYFFDDPLLQHICGQSNLFALQKSLTKPLNLQREELEQFIGSSIYMSIYKLPRSRLYWSQKLRFEKIADLISRDRWQFIKSNLHFNDNANMPDAGVPNRDRLFKIRPLIEQLLPKFRNLEQTQMLCVDEQMVPFKGHSSLRQYIPSKPYKWGYKIFILCDTKGLVHNFDIYTGVIKAVPGRVDIGASGNIVLQLSEVVKPDTCLLYFDNWFSSVKLFLELFKAGIPALGTIRPNRLPGCTLASDAALKKKGRGSYDEKEGVVDGMHLRVVKWFDNRPVILASSFASAQPLHTLQRWDKAKKMNVAVKCPNIVRLYNQFMGGVDALDALLAYYRIHIRSKKFYLRFFFHFIDLCLVNAWLLYRRDCMALAVTASEHKALLDFRIDVADSLMMEGKDLNKTRKRGRPSSSSVEVELQSKRRRGPTNPVPVQAVRTDSIGHWPDVTKRQHCKLPGCKKQTVFICTKCQVHLCLTKNNNCFLRFHS